MLRQQQQQHQQQQRRLAAQADAATESMFDDVRDVLQLLGVPWVMAPEEAEAQCCFLERMGLVDAVVSDDSDCFCFGAKTLYRNVFSGRSAAELYRADEVALALTRGNAPPSSSSSTAAAAAAAAAADASSASSVFTNLALLLGGDYCDGITGVGVVNAMEIISAFDGDLAKFSRFIRGQEDAGSMGEKVRAFAGTHGAARSKWRLPPNFPSESVLKAYTSPVVDESDAPIRWGTIDWSALQGFCSSVLHLPQHVSQGLLDPVRFEYTSIRVL
jgi:DNA excision repair protein ERCC-5